MIVDEDGVRWGTAAEIAEQLGRGVTADAVRKWATRDGLPSARFPGDGGRPKVCFPLLAAAHIERAKRLGRRGRKRPS